MPEGRLALPRVPDNGARQLRTQTVEAGLGPVEQEVHTLASADGTLVNLADGSVQLRALRPLAYWSSAAGGRRSLEAAVRRQALVANTEALVAVLLNPAGSGVDVVLDVRTLTQTQRAAWRRVTNPTVTLPATTGSDATPANLGGGAYASPARMIPGNATGLVVAGGTSARFNYLEAYTDDEDQLDGSRVLRPGQSVAWYATLLTGGDAALSVAWHDRPAAA